MKLYLVLIFSSVLYANPIFPGNGAILNYIHVLFEWEQTPNTNYYNIEIAEDVNFSNIVYITTDSTLCFIERNHLEWDEEYYDKFKKTIERVVKKGGNNIHYDILNIK